MRDTASKVFPSSLLLAGRDRSTITSTKSTRISITPKTLFKKKNRFHLSHSQILAQNTIILTHRNPKDMTKGVIFLRILLQMRGDRMRIF